MVSAERLRSTRAGALSAPRDRRRAATEMPMAAAVLALQRSAGNHAVGRLLRQTASDVPRVGGRENRTFPRLRELFEGVAKERETALKHDAPPSLPWLPHARTNLPIPMGEGTRRSPKLKDPGAPGGAKCRGACGVDCPSTCKNVGTYREQYVVGKTGYLIEFPNAILCGTHQGCQDHDACFDAAVGQGEEPLSAPIHTECNVKALKKWGRENTMSWMRGGGPYETWWYFVDNPFVVEKWAVKS